MGQLSEGRVSRVTQKIDANQNDVIEMRNRFDEHGNIIEALDPLGTPDGHTHRRVYAFDAENLRVIQSDILLEDPEGQPYILRRESRYEPRFDKLSEATSWIRVVDGEPQSSRRSTFYTYDEFARLTSTTRPGGDTANAPTETYTYDLGSTVSRVVVQQRSSVGAASDLETVRCFDGRGRRFQDRTRLEEGRYQVTGFVAYNIKNLPERVYQPYIGTTADCDEQEPTDVLYTQYTFDAVYRQLETILPDENIYDGQASRKRMEYEPFAIRTFDPEDTDEQNAHFNTPTLQRTNGLNLLINIDRSLQPEQFEPLEVRYDELGRLRGYIDPAGHEKIQHYDLLDRIVRVEDPNTSQEAVYTYDNADNMLTATDARGITTVATYDGTNRLVAQWDQDAQETTQITWHYDVTDLACEANQCTNPEGRLVAQSYPGLDGARHTEHFGYDVRNRIIFQSRTLEGFTYQFNLDYDNADRLISTTYPDGRMIERTYDDASRLTSIDGIVHTIAYDERSLLESVGCADGTGTQRQYDDRMRLAQMTTSGPEGELLQGFAYQRDRVDNLLHIEDLGDPQQGRPSYEARHSYDAWYRLQEAHLAPGGEQDEVLSLNFDNIDNLRAKTSSLQSRSSAHIEGPLSYEGTGPNALTQAGDLTMSYDAGGYASQRGNQTLTWDFLGRMTGVTERDQSIARFAYGGRQSRVLKQESDSVTHYGSFNYEVRDGISFLYVKHGRDRVARIASDALATSLLSDVAPLAGGDDQINVADAWVAHASAQGFAGIETSANTSAPGRLLWSSVRRQLSETRTEITHLHHDHLGSITLATDGGVVGQRGFYPLGGERPEQIGYVDEYGFTGQERDRSTGLVHFDWRYLDTSTGRWVSMDPLFYKLSTGQMSSLGEFSTAYAYVGNNAINQTDPTGLFIKRYLAKKKAKKIAKNNRTLDSSAGNIRRGDLLSSKLRKKFDKQYKNHKKLNERNEAITDLEAKRFGAEYNNQKNLEKKYNKKINKLHKKSIKSKDAQEAHNRLESIGSANDDVRGEFTANIRDVKKARHVKKLINDNNNLIQNNAPHQNQAINQLGQQIGIF